MPEAGEPSPPADAPPRVHSASPEWTPGTGPRPAAVVASICLWSTYLVTDAVGGNIELLPASSTAIVPQAIGILLGALVINMAMLVFMLVMSSGLNWARIALAVCGTLRLLLGLLVLIGGALNSFTAYLSLLLLLLAAAIVTMFTPAGNRWFTSGDQAGRRRGPLPNYSMSFCSNCGNQIELTSRFCRCCGTRVLLRI